MYDLNMDVSPVSQESNTLVLQPISLRLRASARCLLLPLFLIVLGATTPAQPPTAEDWFRIADEAVAAGRWDEARGAFERALALHRESGDRQGEAYTFSELGTLSRQLGRHRESLEFYRQAAEIQREIGDEVGWGMTLTFIGQTHAFLGESQKAIETYQESVRLLEGKAPFAEAIALNALGIAHLAAGRPETALPLAERALALQREEADPAGIGAALAFLGGALQALGRSEEALEPLLEALDIHRRIESPLGVQTTLDALGGVYSSLNRHREALDSTLEALELARRSADRRSQAWLLLRAGATLSDLDRHAEAIESFRQARVMFEELGQPIEAAEALNGVGDAYRAMSRFQEAEDHFQQALAIHRQVGNRAGETAPLNNLGFVQLHLGRVEEAIDHFQRALAAARETDNKRGAATALNNLGEAYRNLSRYEEALEHYQQALTLQRETGDLRKQATALNNIAAIHTHLSRHGEAVATLESALRLAEQTGDRNLEATVYNNLANSHRTVGRYDRAAEYFEKALPLMEEIGNRLGAATVLANLSECLRFQNRFDLALDASRRALDAARQIQAPATEAVALNTQGLIHHGLGQPEKAAEAFRMVLELQRRLGNRSLEAVALNNLAATEAESGRYESAERLYRQALTITREIGDRASEGITLSNLGQTVQRQGRGPEAVEIYREALEIHREVDAKVYETVTLGNLAYAHLEAEQPGRAVELFHDALRLSRQIEDRTSEASTLAGLLYAHRDQGLDQLAIFFGKQAVNLFQEVRSGLRTLENELQQSFLRSKEGVYRDLADLLMAHSRIPEAQQVLRLLKEEEYFQFVRRGADESAVSSRADLTGREARWAEAYGGISQRLAAIGRERGELLQLENWTPEQESRLDELDQQLAVAEEGFQRTLRELASAFGGRGAERVRQLDEERGLMEDLRELGRGAVALYTLAGEDRLWVVLITPDFRRAHHSSITAADLARKVFAFRQTLQNPASDPVPLAREFFDLLVGPLAADLEGFGAKTLMWSLDGALRYLPTAALHDGEGFLAEKYRQVLYTPASKPRLKDLPDPSWRALGLGVSQALGNFSALPSVVEELHGIIREGGEGDDGGVLPGSVRLDEAFTADAFRSTLLRRYPLLHIASHFMFRPGNEEDSFLLLGDGSRLSLAEIKRRPNLFGGVDLLTLSACNTAVGGSGGDGREVEGFAVLAQRQGAKAVLATLWQVEDQSTSLLMREFYRLREGGDGMSKAEALRRAQMTLLRSGYQHPYFWAPFVLIGNWR